MLESLFNGQRLVTVAVIKIHHRHCVKNVRIWSYYEYGEIMPYSFQMREDMDQITPNTDTFHAVRCLTGIKYVSESNLKVF